LKRRVLGDLNPYNLRNELANLSGRAPSRPGRTYAGFQRSDGECPETTSSKPR
jgi:hypothetical protein